MGRRSKVDLYGLLARTIELYEQGKTLREIEAIFRSEGYDISRESIRRKVQSLNEMKELYQKTFYEVKALIDAVKENPQLDILELITSLLTSKVFEFTKSIEEIEFEDPYDFIGVVKQLTDAQIKIAKFKLEYTKGFEDAKKQIMLSIQQELEKYPDLKEKLLQIVQNLQVPEK